MTCEQAELRMAELLAGEIATAEQKALEGHLLDCEACRGDFELARAGARVDWADMPVPKEVIEATLAAFREPPAAVRLLRWATAAAAVFGVAVLLVTSSRTPRPASCPVAEPRAERRELLATMQEAVVGALVCKDEDGRPVGELGLKSHDVTVEILDGIAKTTVEENFENHTDRRLEGTFNFPLPSDASISRLALEVNGKIEEGTCLERERAREVFESIVRRMQDPALLEWQPGGFFKCRVFPIEPRSTKRVIVAYTQALPCFRGKMTYVYPLASEKTRTHPPEEVRISVLARFSGALAKIESPSHRLDVQRRNANEASMVFRAANYRPNNDFVVTMDPGDEEVRVVSHRPEGEDGYFACFLTPRGGSERAPGRYAFVLDASASISAPRLEVAKRLVRAMMERRIPGDRFEILAHNVEVERSGEVDLRAANDFLDRLRPVGGSDVLKALQAAGDAEAIYIGKGSPSFGESDPAKILEALKGRRIRTIAVGSDANGLLLEKLGGMMRVSPNDDVDKRVGEIAATIGSPVLSELKVEGEGITEVVGARDLFYGERVVVSGRYREGATTLRVTGSGYRREVEVALPAKEEGNNYVRRLWAQRKVSDLLAQGESKKAEVTALGVKHQIMTPFTSFLVLETEQMWKDHQLKREVQKQDEVLGKSDDARERNLLFGQAQLYFEREDFVHAAEICDKILKVNPNMAAVQEMKNLSQRFQHMKRGADVDLKKLTDGWKREFDRGELTTAVQSDHAEPGPAGKLSKSFRLKPEKPEEAPPPLPAIIKTPPPLPEDPKARAIREAYEEQLRRDRQEVTINTKNASVDQIVEEFRRQTGWNIILDHKNIPSDLRIDEMRITKENAQAALDALAARNEFSLDYQSFEATASEQSLRLGRSKGKLELYDVQDLTYAMADFPGVDITLAQDSINDAPIASGRTNIRDTEDSSKSLPATSAGITGVFKTPAANATSKAARINDLQRQLDAAGTLGEKYEADMQVFVRQLEVTRAQAQRLPKKVEENLEFPDMQEWKELIGKRKPKGVSQLTEEDVDGDKNIIDKLHSIRATIDMKNAPLTAVVDHLREISGLNFHISGIDNPDAEIVTVKSQDEALDSALRRILEPRNKTYVVREGVVIITTPEAILQMRSISEDGSKVLLAGKGVDIGALVAVTRNSKFVALLRVERAIEGFAAARVLQGLAVGRILPGDGVSRVGDAAAYLSTLPEEVRKDLASRSSQQAIRAKMGLKQ